MAHTCPECGMDCHCNGDIGDCCFDDGKEQMNCTHHLDPSCCGYEDELEDDWGHQEEEDV